MKRDTTCSVSIATEHPQMAEDANLKSTYTPGRQGGTFGLPLGAKLLVPEGMCGKKDSLTCRVAPPSTRWQHAPHLSSEHVTSEIFTLTGSVQFKQSSVILILPYYPPTDQFVELNVKGLWKDEDAWVDVGFITKMIYSEGLTDTPQPCVELEIDRLGTFVVTFRSRTEQFHMTPNGGLFHCRLNRNLSVRFPKKAVDTTVNFNLQIQPVPEERVAFCREYYQQDCADLVIATEFIDFRPDVQCNFRRAATIKLPLPGGVEVEGESCNEVVVLHKNGDGRWQWVESKYKFTRSSVTFDVKNPSKFCVVKSKPDRHKKMQDAVRVLEERLGKDTGEVSVFLSVKEKSWMAVVECYPQELSAAKVKARQDQGFRVVSKADLTPKSQSTQGFSRRSMAMAAAAREYRPKTLDGFELFDGLTWAMEVKDELKVSDQSDLHQNGQLRVFKHLKESYRRFVLEPTIAEDENRSLRGTLTLEPVGVAEPQAREQLTLTFHLDLSQDEVRDYFYVPPPPPEPEPVKAKPKYDLPSLMASTETRPPPKTSMEKVRTFSASAMQRLTQSTRRPNVPDREAKVISGKSLMALSKVVNEGLTLAVHLELPDSTITGIGFDALANGRSMSEVGYKILLYWKRTRKDKREGAVQHLLQGLRSMGKHGVADIVQNRHQQNKELSMDCFLMAAVSGVDISH